MPYTEKIISAKDAAEGASKHAERENRNAETIVGIAAELPVGLPLLHIYPHGHKCAASIKLQYRTRAEAAAALDILPPVPVARVKDTFLSHIPAESITDKQHESAEVDTELLPAFWEHDALAGRPESWLQWWTRLESGCLLGVKAVITEDPAYYRENHERATASRGRKGRIIRYRWDLQNAPHGDSRRFSSGDMKRPGRTVITFWAEPGGGAPTLETLLADD